jgi:DNA-binding NtrC family response regulator
MAREALMQISQEEGRNFDRISDAAAARLMAHPWPGNVRQLLNMIRVAVVMYDGPVLEAQMIEPAPSIGTPAMPDPYPAGQTLAQIERSAIEAALRRNAQSVPRAARELDVAASTLYRKIAGWGAAD